MNKIKYSPIVKYFRDSYPKKLLGTIVVILTVTILGYFMDIFKMDNFKLQDFFSANVTGISFSLALFTACINNLGDNLKILASSSSTSGKDNFFNRILYPFLYTALIFLLGGLISLFAPFLNIDLPNKIVGFFEILYLNLMAFGLISLFNLLIIVFGLTREVAKCNKSSES